MRIVRTKDETSGEPKYHIASFPGQKGTHKYTCPFAGDTFSSLKGYSKDEKGNISFTVSVARNPAGQDVIKGNEEEIDSLIASGHQQNVTRYFKQRGVRQNKLTFNGFVSKMLTDAWNSFYRSRFSQKVENRNPVMNSLAFLDYFFGKSAVYKYNGKVVRNLLASRFNKPGFEIGLLDPGHNLQVNDKGFFEVQLNRTNNNFKKFVPKELWDGDLIHPNSDHIVIIRKGKKGYCEEVSIVPVNSHGLHSESSYEALFYEKLVEHNILFEKPYEIHDYMSYPYVPDALISSRSEDLNPNYNDIFNVRKGSRIIFELFGVQGNENYDNLKDRKIEAGNIISESPEWETFVSLDASSIRDVEGFFH